MQEFIFTQNNKIVPQILAHFLPDGEDVLISVSQFIKGNSLELSAGETHSPDDVQQNGYLLAEFHKAGEELAKDKSQGQMLLPLQQLQEDAVNLDDIADKILPVIKKSSNKLHKVIAHGDFCDGNVIRTPNNDFVAIDFEHIGVGCRIFDIAIAVNGFCIKDKVINDDNIRAFIAGYEQISTLTRVEKDIFPVMAKASNLRYCILRSQMMAQNPMLDVKPPTVFLDRIPIWDKWANIL